MRSSVCPEFGLVIPTLNEGENLPLLLSRIQKSMRSMDLTYEVLIVDDDSRDGTAEVVADYAASDASIRLLVRHGCTGLAGAVIHGWKHTNASLLGVMDGDLQHPPELVPVLVDRVRDGVDIAVASRYAQALSAGGLSPARKAISRVGTLVSMPLQRPGLRIQDPLSGFFVIRRECIEGVDLQPEGFKILLEILARGNVRSVAEVPFQFSPRLKGTSKASVTTGFQYLSLLYKLLHHARFGNRKSA